MAGRTRFRPRAAAALVLAAFAAAAACAGEPLVLRGRTELASYQGDFDHFAADVKGGRLFLAGEDGNTLEVFDIRTGAHRRTVSGLAAPHAIHFDGRHNRLVVTASEGPSKVLDGRSYAAVRALDVPPGADVMGHDPSTDTLWVVTGGKNASPKIPFTELTQLDAGSGKVLGSVRFDTDFTEGVVAEQKGARLFVNLAGRSEVAVLDKSTRQRLATWPLQDGQQNSAIDLDEANQRLFVITRKPFKLLVLDTRTGQTVASLDAPPRTNALAFDRANHRIYAAGDRYVAVYRQQTPDRYVEEARVQSEYGAKTALLVPALRQLYVAVAGSKQAKAALLRYEVLPETNP